MLRIMIIKHVIIFNAQTYTIVDLKGIQSIRNYNYYFVVVVEVAVFEQRWRNFNANVKLFAGLSGPAIP